MSLKRLGNRFSFVVTCATATYLNAKDAEVGARGAGGDDGALDAMADGDGKAWTPKVTVKGGASGFYSIRVSKE